MEFWAKKKHTNNYFEFVDPLSVFTTKEYRALPQVQLPQQPNNFTLPPGRPPLPERKQDRPDNRDNSSLSPGDKDKEAKKNKTDEDPTSSLLKASVLQNDIGSILRDKQSPSLSSSS